jgi:S-DNA-T family DNA segregation ATPase FtsK/SpoIIIE
MVSMATMGVSYLVPLLNHLANKREFAKETAERKRIYEAELKRHRKELEDIRFQQKKVLGEVNPPPEECIQRIRDWSGTVWNRSPRDDDFLRLRLGVGEQPFCVTVKAPQQQSYEKDLLIEAAQELQHDFRSVPNVPVTFSLPASRVVGIVGERQAVDNIVRLLTLQIAIHHSPDEVKLAAIFNEEEAESWEWMRWLPHIWDEDRRTRFLAKDMSSTRQLLDNLYNYLSPRKQQEHNSSSNWTMALPAWVFFLSDIPSVEDEPLVHLLMRDAWAMSAYTFVLSDRKETLPMECGAIIEVAFGEARLIETVVTKQGSEETISRETPFLPDRLSVGQADEASRLLAPYRLKKSAAGEIPRVLTLFNMFDVREVGELEAAAQWQKNRYPDTLPVTVGARAGGKPVQLNIHDKIERKGHGPHGLIAGTTGSGKSEVIQSLIASLALRFHPHDLAFMLIDYKGGGMSNTFEKLPHVVASITNLEGGGLIERAQVSLKAELERRQRIFNAAGNLQHIDEYYRSPLREKEPLPHLVIVIDEFAQLKKDHPDFMSELISIAAIGRTLGVHLILATQKPAGVVDDKIWSNSRFRICLRVQDEADSRDMLRVPDAAKIAIPGRGYLQVGSNEVFELVQFAWSGAPYYPDEELVVEEAEVFEVALNGSRYKVSTVADTLVFSSKAPQSLAKQLQVFIDYLAEEADKQGIDPLPGPWSPPLAEELFLESIHEGDTGWDGVIWRPYESWLRPSIGLIDDLARQIQRPLTFPLEEGNLIVYGMPGTGKTTLLQSLLLALATEYSPRDVHLYGLDFGRMLKDFDGLPHCGGIIQGDEDEKCRRLFRYLKNELNRRKQVFSEEGVKTLFSYREISNESLPAIFTFIDGYLNFKDSYPDEHDAWEMLLREGPGFGIYFVVSANRVSDIFDKIRSNFSLAFSFELADPSDYYFAVGRPVKPLNRAPEGRGLVKGSVPPLEAQIALPAKGSDEFQRTLQIRQTVQQMKEAWTEELAYRIPMLPDRFPLRDLLENKSAVPVQENKVTFSGNELVLKVPVALETEDLLPFKADLLEGPYFLIGSRMEGGKTSLLLSWLLSLASVNSPDKMEMYLVDFRRSSTGLSAIRKLPHVRAVAGDESRLLGLLEPFRKEVERRKEVVSNRGDFFGEEPGEHIDPNNPAFPALILAIDDGELLARQISGSYEIQGHLEWIFKNGRDLNVFVLFAALPGEIGNIFDSWLSPIKNAQTGFLLGSTDNADLNIFKLKLPFTETGKILPPGQGFYVRNKHTAMKGALPFEGGETPTQWEQRINAIFHNVHMNDKVRS